MSTEELDYRKILESSPGLYLILRPDLTIAAVTDAYLSATMTKREAILGRGIFDVFPDNPNDLNADGVSNLSASLKRVLTDKVPDTMPVQKYDIRKPDSEGGEFEERYWSPFNSPVLDANGNVKYIVHRVEDVTEVIKLKEEDLEQKEQNVKLRSLSDSLGLEIFQRNEELKRTNAALREANQALTNRTEELKRSNDELSRFAATASHDIKTSFRNVGTYLGIIRKKLPVEFADEEISDLFVKIEESRNRISTLLDDLLSYAQATQSKEPFTEVNINEVISEALQNNETGIRETNVQIDVQEAIPSIRGNPSQLVQLFQNLIANAVKFNRNSYPRINISMTQEKNQFHFSVKDNGIGIESKYFSKIFQVFERLNGQEEYSGSGLGLAICKSIVEHHGGKIWVESVPEKGTTFHFTLLAKN